MKQLVLLILAYSQISQGVLEWTVVGKVTDYGQNVTLFCNVSNCCPKDAGWDRWTPVQRTLYIDVKTGRSNKKYDGKILSDGYTLIIQNLTKEDLNVSYSCLYGVTFGKIKFLLERDVFKNISTIQTNVNSILSGGNLAGIILGIVVSVVVTVFFIIHFWRKKRHKNGTKGPDDKVESARLMDYFLEKPSNIDCIEGEDATFSCKIQPNSALVEWLKDGNTIKSSDNCIVSIVDSQHELKLLNTKPTDSGKYCVRVGEFSREMQLNIIRIPRELSADERNTYMHAIKSGTEVRQYVRIQVVGKDRVGKTSLVRRLLFLEKVEYGGKSTDGIDISRKCKIRTSDGDWIVGEVVDLTSENCNTDILSTSLNKDVQLILTRNESGNVSGIDGCYYIVNLDYGTFMRSKTEVTVSVKSMLDCGYKVEIYPGEPLINKNIETLDCDSNPTWTGHFPTTTIFLRYVTKTKKDINYISTRFDNMMTNIIYRSCSSCYQTPTIYGIPKERLTGYCGREVCVGDRDVEYSYMYPSYWNNFGWCPPCRSIAFYVNDSAQICFESYQYMYVWGRELCHVTVEINNNSVLVLKNSLREKWCLPWSLKHKRIEFTFGDDFNLKCYSTTRCIANIRIIPDNKDSQLCPIQTPKEWRTRTGYSSLYAESGDEYNDSKNMTAIIYLIISSVLVMVCGCFCKYTYKRKSKESEPRPVEGMNRMQNTIHQRTEDQPTASESSDEELGYSENMRGSIRDVRNVPEIGPVSVHGTTFANDNSETINDEQLQDATQNYPHLHLHQLSSWSENIEYYDTDQPPSYEEVSRCDQPR